MTQPSTSTLQPASWYERHVLLADVLAALVAILIFGISGAASFSGHGWAGIAVPLAICALMAIRRTAPMPYVAATAVLAVIEMLALPTASGAPSDAMVLVAVHAAARYCPRGFGYFALGLSIFGAIWASYSWIYRSAYNERPSITEALVGGAFLVATAGISYALGRAQRAKAGAIEAQMAALAERSRLLQLEHQRQLELSTAEERGRLAAETHDILAHSLAIIVAQADGASMVVSKDPSRAQQAIEQIGETAREALTEVRQQVAALRRGEDPTSDLAPAKGVGDLPELAETVGRAGLTVDLEVVPDLGPLTAGVSLSAYRIVQEALTNTLKHAGPKAHARVSLSRCQGMLQVEVEDDGRGGAPSSNDGEGNGLRGMRTRVEQYGGELHAGPRLGGGFSIRASLPLPISTKESS